MLFRPADLTFPCYLAYLPIRQPGWVHLVNAPHHQYSMNLRRVEGTHRHRIPLYFDQPHLPHNPAFLKLFSFVLRFVPKGLSGLRRLKYRRERIPYVVGECLKRMH